MPWVEYLPIKDTDITGVLGDIESHLPRAHPYKDDDKVTWTHEGTHGVNSGIRNSLTTNMNAAYLLKNWAFTAEEPDFRLSDLAGRIPKELRGHTYDLYVIRQQRWWNHQPLYMFDELTAYLNGAKAGVELGMDNRAEYSAKSALDFLGYGAIIKQMADTQDYDSFFTYVCFQGFNPLVEKFSSLKNQYEKVLKYLTADAVP